MSPSASTSLAVVFVANGLGLPSFIARLAERQRDLELSDIALGATVLGMSFGALASSPLAAWAVHRYGSRQVTTGAAVAIGVSLWATGAAPSAPLTFVALAVAGAADAAMDAAMNANGAAFEASTGRSALAPAPRLVGAGRPRRRRRRRPGRQRRRRDGDPPRRRRCGPGRRRDRRPSGTGRRRPRSPAGGRRQRTEARAPPARRARRGDHRRGGRRGHHRRLELAAARSSRRVDRPGAARFRLVHGGHGRGPLRRRPQHRPPRRSQGPAPGHGAVRRRAGRRRPDRRAARLLRRCRRRRLRDLGVLPARVLRVDAGARHRAGTGTATIALTSRIGFIIEPLVVGAIAEATDLRVAYLLAAAIAVAIAVAAPRWLLRRDAPA